MPLTGDFGRLQSTIRGLRALAQVPSQLARPVSVAIKAEIDHEFATSTDPYGQRWAAHAPATTKRWGKHPLLRLTGGGQASISVTPAAGAGVSVHIPSKGLTISQSGSPTQPRRRVLPDDRMPKRWRIAIESAATVAVKEALRGTG